MTVPILETGSEPPWDWQHRFRAVYARDGGLCHQGRRGTVCMGPAAILVQRGEATDYRLRSLTVICLACARRRRNGTGRWVCA